jgi:ABC-type branched-subunit amino acid transport system ATPase component
MLIVQQVSKSFGSFQALDKVSFEMKKAILLGY